MRNSIINIIYNWRPQTKYISGKQDNDPKRQVNPTSNIDKVVAIWSKNAQQYGVDNKFWQMTKTRFYKLSLAHCKTLNMSCDFSERPTLDQYVACGMIYHYKIQTP